MSSPPAKSSTDLTKAGYKTVARRTCGLGCVVAAPSPLMNSGTWQTRFVLVDFHFLFLWDVPQHLPYHEFFRSRALACDLVCYTSSCAKPCPSSTATWARPSVRSGLAAIWRPPFPTEHLADPADIGTPLFKLDSATVGTRKYLVQRDINTPIDEPARLIP